MVKRTGRNWRSKYLTKDDFNEWKDNHFHTLTNKVSRIEGTLGVLVVLVIGILLGIIQLLFGIF